MAGGLNKVHVLWLDSIPHESRIMLVRGQIPDEYTVPFREVSVMTPVEPYSPWPTAIMAALAAAAATGGTIYFLKKRK